MVSDSNSANGDDGRVERLQVMLDAHELAAVDDFRFKRRMPSRAAAVRELLKRGLAAEGFLSATAGMKSSEFGVIERGEPEADARGKRSRAAE
jgi:hypothetical protein